MIDSSRRHKKWRIRSCEVWVPGRILEIFKGGGLVCCLPDPKRLEILMISFVLLQQTACRDGNHISVLF